MANNGQNNDDEFAIGFLMGFKMLFQLAGAVAAAYQEQEQPQPCTGCGEVGTCRCTELDDNGHLLNVPPEEIDKEGNT